MPEGGSRTTWEELESRLKQAEQQRSNLQDAKYGQRTESGRYRHGNQQNEDADTPDLDGEEVPDEKIVRTAGELKARKTK